MDAQTIIVLITIPSLEVGEKIAEVLLDQKLAACISIIPAIRSFYLWKGSVHRDEESLLMVKSQANLFKEDLLPAVLAIHPYEVPEIIALPILMGNPSYLDWIREITGNVGNSSDS